MKAGDLIPVTWDPSLIALSFAIALMGALVALQCAVAIRRPDGRINGGQLAAAALALGGGAIWSMHFIGMYALNLPAGMTVGYDFGQTVVSMAAAIGLSAIALWITAAHPRRFVSLLAGGLLAGAGVALMHYLGMGAMRFRAIIEWNGTLIGMSILIAIVAATLSLWLAFNTRGPMERIAAALVMAVAVCGMHYTGMNAAQYICTTAEAGGRFLLGGRDLPLYVFMTGAFVLSLVTVVSTLSNDEAYDERSVAR